VRPTGDGVPKGVDVYGIHWSAGPIVGLTIGLLLSGCAFSAATPPVATPNPTAPPTSATMPAAAPLPTGTQTPRPDLARTPEPVAGWPTVSRAGVTMTGADDGSAEMDGRLRLSITMTGLAPEKAVYLTAAGEYAVTWMCGVAPEPCGELGCGPSSYDNTDGTAKAAGRAVAASDGTAATQIEIVAAPPAGACPTDSTARWSVKLERWEKVTVADPSHGLILTPDTIERGVTF
jgi:hypothetical protein